MNNQLTKGRNHDESSIFHVTVNKEEGRRMNNQLTSVQRPGKSSIVRVRSWCHAPTAMGFGHHCSSSTFFFSSATTTIVLSFDLRNQKGWHLLDQWNCECYYTCSGFLLVHFILNDTHQHHTYCMQDQDENESQSPFSCAGASLKLSALRLAGLELAD